MGIREEREREREREKERKEEITEIKRKRSALGEVPATDIDVKGKGSTRLREEYDTGEEEYRARGRDG